MRQLAPPGGVRRALRSARSAIGRTLRRRAKAPLQPGDCFSLTPELPLPPGVSEPELRAFLETVVAAGAPADEVRTYCSEDFRRFVYTYGLLRDVSGSCLELGANPYLTTVLLRTFTDLRLTLANYFGAEVPRLLVQDVSYSEFRSGRQASVQLESHHFNIEEEPFPFETDAFDAVLFCEIIEHLLVDPQAVLLEIKRVLKPGGVLIITTPNVSRLENVARMAAGLNIYDPYSGYGPYGRHNREYNRHELWLLLRHLGFEIVTA